MEVDSFPLEEGGSLLLVEGGSLPLVEEGMEEGMADGDQEGGREQKVELHMDWAALLRVGRARVAGHMGQ